VQVNRIGSHDMKSVIAELRLYIDFSCTKFFVMSSAWQT